MLKKAWILFIILQISLGKRKQIMIRKENTQAPIVVQSPRMVRVDPEYDDNMMIPENQLHLARPIEHKTHQFMDPYGNVVQHHITMQRNAHGRVTAFTKMQTSNGQVDFVHRRHIGKKRRNK